MWAALLAGIVLIGIGVYVVSSGGSLDSAVTLFAGGIILVFQGAILAKLDELKDRK